MVATRQKGNAREEADSCFQNGIHLHQCDAGVGEGAARLCPAHAEALAAELDLDAMGIPVLSYRDGVYWIVDGQHRIRAMEILDFGDYKIQCGIRDLTEQEEALLFLARDERRAITPLDKFRIAVFGGAPTPR